MRFGPLRGRYQLLCRHRTPKRRSKLPKARFPLVMKTRERDGNDDERSCGVDATENGHSAVNPKYSPLSCRIPSSLCMNGQRHHGGFRTPLTRTTHARGYVARSCKICSGGRSSGQDKQKTALRSRYQAPTPAATTGGLSCPNRRRIHAESRGTLGIWE